MKEIEIAEQLLQEVLENKAEFLEALKNTFKNQVELRPYRNTVAGLLGCELRHHLLMEYLCKKFEGMNEQAKRFVYLGLANNYYYKHLDAEAVRAFVNSKLSKEEVELVAPLFDKAKGEKPEFIPEDVDRNSRLYLSLRYNAPEWAIKILMHYGEHLTARILRKYARPVASTLRLRTSLAGEHALDGNEDFTPSKVPGIYCYQGHQSLRKNELYRNGKIFMEKMLIKAISDENLVEAPAEILLYNGNKDCSFELELLETYGNKIGMNLACPEVDEKLDIKKALKAEGLTNVNFFSAKDPTFMEADISHPQDLVFAVPNSTNFDKIPETPDYLLRFNTDEMDQILAQEKEVLEGCAKYVDVHGKLIYMIFTLSKKEGKATIVNFLKAHPEFKLLKQNEYFPFAEYETSAYVAVLEKVEETLTAPSPLTDLAQTISNPTYSASAASK